MSRKRRPVPASQRYWIGYCRKSSETEDRQVHSLEDQAAMVRDYYDRLPAPERDGRPLKLMQEAQSAYRPGRPVFGQILRMAERGAVWGVIVVHPNRISRNHSDSGAFVQNLVDGFVECLDTTLGKRYTGEDSNDIFMLTLEGAMSWKDSRDKGDRILATMRRRAGEGRYMTLPPFGYRIVYQENGTRSLQVDAEKAAVVRTLFDLAATGTHSLEGLTAQAQRLGLTTRKGQRIYKARMHKLLTNPFFKGYVRFDGVVSRGLHEAIVAESVWARVQRVLHRHSPAATGTGAEPRPQEPFVFRGRLNCPGCTRKLCVYRAKGRYVYYECKNPRTSCGVCVPQGPLLDQLQAVLAKLDLGQDRLATFRQRLLDQHRQRTGDLSAARLKAQAEYDGIQQEIAGVFAGRQDAVRLGIEDVVEEQLEVLKRRRDEVRARLSAVNDTGAAWVDRAIRALELLPLLTEAILFGPPKPRAQALDALTSNSTVEGKNLVLSLRTPFRQAAEGGVSSPMVGHRVRSSNSGSDRRDETRTMVYELRTETLETLELVESACQEWSDTKAISDW